MNYFWACRVASPSQAVVEKDFKAVKTGEVLEIREGGQKGPLVNKIDG